MKTIIRAMVLVALVFVYQACGPKSEKTEETEVEATTEVETDVVDAEQDNASETETAPDEKSHVDNSGTTVYTNPEVLPTYEGGENAMAKYLKNNLKYPSEGTMEGTVLVTFVVDEEGMVRDAEVESGPEDPTLHAEALRVVNSMPKWTPGKEGGKPVRTKFKLPITFKQG